jgi:hypothetical protein
MGVKLGFHIDGRKQAEYVWEQGAKKYFWAKGMWNNKGLEKIV